ncbi:MAG: DUF4340 domain-containing protein [Candidatus Omnitrophica bacterium]|nr:DUF4340 domain-containing protein [Candidatus Omnitrophota bacterium]
MKFKNLLILCVIFFLLGGVVLLKKKTAPEVATTEEMTDIIAPALTLEEMTGVDLRFGNTQTQVQLAKEDGAWKVKSLYGVNADENVLSALVKKLDGLKGELRSEEASLLSDYGISDDQGIHVILRKGESELEHLIIGSKRTARWEVFVRRDKTNKVYLTQDSLLGDFGLWGEVKEENFDKNRWFDKQVLRLDPAQVTAVKVTAGGKDASKTWLDLALQETGNGNEWVCTGCAVPYPFGLSATKIENYLRSFANIRAREVTAPDPAAGFGGDVWKAGFKLKDGKEITLLRGKKNAEGSDYYMKTADAYYYLVPVSSFDGFLRGGGNIFVSNPFKVEEDKITKVEIQDLTAKKKFSAEKAATAPAGADASAEKKEGEQKEAAWKTPEGKDIEKSKVEDILRRWKDLTIYFVSADATPAKDALQVQLTKEGQVSTYTVSEAKKAADGRECQFLKMADNPDGYCYTKSDIDNFLQAVPFH